MIYLGQQHLNKCPVTHGSAVADLDVNLNNELSRNENYTVDAQDATNDVCQESTNKTKRDCCAECTRWLSELEKVTSNFQDFDESVKKINKLMSDETSTHRKITKDLINGGSQCTDGKMVSSNIEHKFMSGKSKRHKSIGGIKKNMRKGK